MGNVGLSCCWSTGDSLSSCNCCDWCSDSLCSAGCIYVQRWLRFLWWLIVRIFDLIATLIIVTFQAISVISSYTFWFALALIISWVFWFTWPYTVPWISGLFVPLLNFALELLALAWYVFWTIFNIFSRLWNAFVPVTWMLLEIVFEIVRTVLEEVVKILGDIKIYSLLKPFMSLINTFSKILTQFIQVIVKVGKPILEAVVKIIPPVLQIYFSLLEIYVKVYGWLYGTLFKLLEPYLKFVLALVKAFTGGKQLVGAVGRELFAFAGAFQVGDDFVEYTLGGSADSAARYWSNERYNMEKLSELQEINDYLVRHPPISFGYLYSIVPPDPGGASFHGDDPSESEEEAEIVTRRLLEHDEQSLGVLTPQERADFGLPAVSFEEFWERFGRDAGAAHEWYRAEVVKSRMRKRDALERVARRLQSADERAYNETVRARHSRRRQRAQTSDPWAGELHKKVPCRSARLCGGHGAPLEHPVLTLRKRYWERQHVPRESTPWREEGETEEQFEKRSVMHLSAWLYALQHAHESVAEPYLKDPRLWGAAAEGWARATGNQELVEWLDETSENYASASHWLFETLCGEKAGEGVAGRLQKSRRRFTAALGVELDDDQYGSHCSEAFRGAHVEQRVHPTRPHRRIAEVVLDPDTHPHHRDVLEALMVDAHEPRSRGILQLAVEQDWGRWLSPETTRRLQELRPDARVLHQSANAGFFGAQLPDPGVNSTGEKADAQRKKQVLESKKPVKRANVPVFELFSKLNCYKRPYHPLCLFEMPERFIEIKAPVVVWPEEVTGDDSYCAPLYCLPPRDLLDWRAYISWCWILNAITSVQLVFSAIFFLLTDKLGVLRENFAWLRWLFGLFLVIDPGTKPTTLDWFCLVDHFYALVLAGALLFIFFTLLYPLLQWFLRFIASFEAMYSNFTEADEIIYQRREADNRLIIEQATQDAEGRGGVSQLGNPGGRRRLGTRDALGRSRTLVEDPQPVSPYGPGNLLTEPRFNARNLRRVPPTNPLSPASNDPEEALLIGESLDELASDATVSEEDFYERQSRHELAEMRLTIERNAATFGTTNYRASTSELERFRRRFGFLLRSYKRSYFYSLQLAWYARKKAKIEYMSPHV